MRVRALLILSILAAGVPLLCRAQTPWPLWEAYSRVMIDPQGRVVDHSAQDRTTSEGQAYAMFFALVDNDRGRFDVLLHWTEQNLAGGDLSQRLPAWSWGKNPDGVWGVIDQNPASDADLWMAYALSEAGRLWHASRYQKLGIALAARIAQQEVAYIPGLGTTLLPGPNGFHPTATTWLLNPSYLPPSLLAYFSKTMPQGPWGAVLQSLDPMLAARVAHGFAMDWVVAGQGIYPSQTPAQLAANDTVSPPIGSYDAIRVYLWLGISDSQTPTVRSLLGDVRGMADYMKQHLTPPEKVDSAGQVLAPSAPPGFSAALIPYLRAAGATTQAREQTDRLASTKNPSTGLYGKDAAYYDQNLTLFATGWIEQRYRFDRDGRLLVHWK
jgi:endo-1,4-beta-D-glucanase Y